MTGSLEGKLLDLDVVVGISTGIIRWCLGETAFTSVDVVGGEILLVEALTSEGPSISVTPAIGTEGSEEGADEVADGWRDTEDNVLFGAECPLLTYPTILPLENPIEPTPAVASHWHEEALPNCGCGLPI